MTFLDNQNEGQSKLSDELEQQRQENDRQIQEKLANLRRQRIAVVKSFGSPDFTGSGANAPIQGKVSPRM